MLAGFLNMDGYKKNVHEKYEEYIGKLSEDNEELLGIKYNSDGWKNL